MKYTLRELIEETGNPSIQPFRNRELTEAEIEFDSANSPTLGLLKLLSLEIMPDQGKLQLLLKHIGGISPSESLD